MPRIRIECILPFVLPLPDGDYADKSGELLALKSGNANQLQLTILPLEMERTRVCSFFESNAQSADRIESEKTAKAKTLVARMNRLIRWYRVVSSNASVSEIILSKGSPYCFFLGETSEEWGSPSIFLDPPLPDNKELWPSWSGFMEIIARVKGGFISGDEPAVENLFLLDARQALVEGRFREAILFFWSTIDSTFNIFYSRLIDSKLAGEWPAGREFMKGLDFPLRNKMTVGLRLLAGTSLFSQPDDFWNKLSLSYNRRNKIIHEGQVASEDDAQQAVSVAEKLVAIVERLAEEHAISVS